MSNAEEDVEQRELLFSAVTVRNDAATVEDSPVASYRTKHRLTI